MDGSKKSSLSESQVREMKTAFAMLDKNQDGRVNLNDIKHMLENLGIKVADTVLQSLIREVSKNDSVSEEDFLSWMASVTQKGQEDDLMEDLMAAFRVFDKDGNGFITRDELKMAMEIIGETMTESQLDEMLHATDIDQDGRINYEEFVKILL
ncbi:calcium-binding protein E63-1-like isoform X1 [Parasteatoda tepidariorum]|uniref:calcium-binding protein E63-1-like isoform X1 n=2 Tax=Parasteatoda tepidariorum TaxID=114398 RepID=UPI001C71E815|nr:calcium-binding protein E63-1-like isoform X2 [Parasteatoda tepidariorum]